MSDQRLISAEEFCSSHQIDVSFIASLHEYGLITATIVETKFFFPDDQLELVEKYSRMRYDLDINMEGIDTIARLLERINTLQRSVQELKERLRLYE